MIYQTLLALDGERLVLNGHPANSHSEATVSRPNSLAGATADRSGWSVSTSGWTRSNQLRSALSSAMGIVPRFPADRQPSRIALEAPDYVDGLAVGHRTRIPEAPEEPGRPLKRHLRGIR